MKNNTLPKHRKYSKKAPDCQWLTETECEQIRAKEMIRFIRTPDIVELQKVTKATAQRNLRKIRAEFNLPKQPAVPLQSYSSYYGVQPEAVHKRLITNRRKPV